MFESFVSRDQQEELRALWKAADAMKFPPACENFPDAFFPDYETPGSMSLNNMAKKMCGDCPIKAQCASYGIRWESDGIWGGISPRDRQNLRAKMRRQANAAS